MPSAACRLIGEEISDGLDPEIVFAGDSAVPSGALEKGVRFQASERGSSYGV